MTGLTGPILWLASITRRAIRSVMCVCLESETPVSRVSGLQHLTRD